MNFKNPMPKMWRKVVATGLLFCLPVIGQADSVLGSKHDLSAVGPGPIKAATDARVCIFCHTPHRSTGDTPLWNHTMSSETNYVLFSSPTFLASVGQPQQPDGSSRLCLSCHDGTVALGMVNSQSVPIIMQNGVTTLSAAGSSSSLGTDLSGDHPISFVYSQTLVDKLAGTDAALNPPTSLTGKVKLDQNNKVQCTSCHDPHDDQFGNFLVVDNTSAALCLNCHVNNNWGTSAHALSTKLVPQTAVAMQTAVASATALRSVVKASASAPTTVAANGCKNCHATHFAGSGPSLLKSAVLEENCLPCHNGSMDTKNIAADFQKISVHPITVNARSHSPQEDPVNPSHRHVTCVDCHNPHAAKTTPGTKSSIAGSLAGVIGVNQSGAVVRNITWEYELCFRCHADSIVRGPARVNRQFSQTNKRVQFNLINQSFHPLETVGKNRMVPSLIAPWTVSSTLDCIDCHNSDESPAAGGLGANGPHGSIYTPLLERQLVLSDYNQESQDNYALCYKCHSRDSILANQSFPFHSKHIVNDLTSCTTCHDSHGVANASHLINFNISYVTPSSNGRLEYVSTGTLHGNCSLTCHGKDHPATPY
jgi:predicted CXXCH cytochrome family protein